MLPRLLTWAVAAVATASLMSAPAAAAGAPTAGETKEPRLLVFGDSISAAGRYRARADRSHVKAWWAHVAERAGMDPTKVKISAQPSSGIVAQGRADCSGTTYAERLDKIERARPDVIIVEVGRNDVRRCVNGRHVGVPPALRERRARAYFSRLARRADRHGVDRSHVYVFTAWGSRQNELHPQITVLYARLVRELGLTWVPVAPLPRSQTVDGIHPTARGSLTLARRVMAASDVTRAIASRGRRTGRVASGVQVRCRGAKACRTLGLGHRGYPRGGRIWGLRQHGPTRYAAHRVTRGRTVAPVSTPRDARSWRADALASGAAVESAVARPGDVAWWDLDPSAAGRSGHVAIVEKVAADGSWVLVTEMRAGGAFRAVRYRDRALPAAYLRFVPTDGSPAGAARVDRARPDRLRVSGVVADTDAPRRKVALRIRVSQGGRTWTRRTSARAFDFDHRIGVRGLRAGRATVQVWAINPARTRGHDRVLLRTRVTVR